MTLSITDDQMEQLEIIQKTIDETLTNERSNGNEEIIAFDDGCGGSCVGTCYTCTSLGHY